VERRFRLDFRFRHETAAGAALEHFHLDSAFARIIDVLQRAKLHRHAAFGTGHLQVLIVHDATPYCDFAQVNHPGAAASVRHAAQAIKFNVTE
jgi:hypothetical protein